MTRSGLGERPFEQCPRLALRVGSLRRTDSVAIEGIADIRRSLAARWSDVNDPTETWMAQDFCSAYLPHCLPISPDILSCFDGVN